MSGEGGGAVPDPDVEITARVSADELTFHEVPDVVSHTRAEPAGEGTSGSERSGVPHGVRAGTVHRDIRVDYRLASRLTEAPEGEEPDR
ncbi:hypothetical protein SUDANB121_01834 [Nocardiopsis dassonvillei]|uniref:hypothetical protein n=1 Tax=Nocardiopsis dassonvillei TaxID=2014 RepID=UPI003F5564E9